MVMTFLIFIMCTVILLLIFLPKIILQRRYAGLSKGEQKKLMSLAISVNQKSSMEFRKDGGGDPSSQPFTVPKKANKREESSQYVSDLTPAEFIESNWSKLEIGKEDGDISNSTYSLTHQPTRDGASSEKEKGTREVDATVLFCQILSLTKTDDSQGSLKDFLELVDCSKLSSDQLASLKEAKSQLETQESAR